MIAQNLLYAGIALIAIIPAFSFAVYWFAERDMKHRCAHKLK